MATAAKKTKIPALPLRWRLHAWWEGYDADELAKRLAAEREAKNKPAEPVQSAEATPEPDAPQAAEAPHKPYWNDARLAAAQFVWGEGFVAPFDEANILELAKRLRVDRSHHVIHLCAELGGLNRVLNERFGCTIANLDPQHAFIEAARSLGNDVREQLYEVEPGGSPYDFALIGGLVHGSGQLAKLLRLGYRYLEPQGVIAARIYTLKDERAVTSAHFRQWAAQESLEQQLPSSGEIDGMIQHAGLNLRAKEDCSLHHVELIEQTWTKALSLMRTLQRDETIRHLAPYLLEDAERWRRHVELIRDGTLAIYNIAAVRREAQHKLLSNW